jgi:hypothetical protein
LTAFEPETDSRPAAPKFNNGDTAITKASASGASEKYWACTDTAQTAMVRIPSIIFICPRVCFNQVAEHKIVTAVYATAKLTRYSFVSGGGWKLPDKNASPGLSFRRPLQIIKPFSVDFVNQIQCP